MKFVTVLALAATASSMPVKRQLADGLAGASSLDGITGTASISDAPPVDYAQPIAPAVQPVYPAVDDTLDDLIPPPDADDDDDAVAPFGAVGPFDPIAPIAPFDPIEPFFVKRHGVDGDDDEVPVALGLDADVVVAVDPLDALIDVGAGIGKRDDIDIVSITHGNIPIESTAEYKEGEQGVVKRQEVTVITTTQGNIPITSSGSYKEGEQGALDTSPLSGSGSGSGSSPTPNNGLPPPPSNDEDDDDFRSQSPPPSTQVNNNPPPQQNIPPPPPPQNNNSPPPPPSQNNNGQQGAYPRPGRPGWNGGGNGGGNGQGWNGGRGKGNGGGNGGGAPGWNNGPRGGWNRPGNSPNQAGLSIGINLGGKDGLLGGRGGLLGDRGPLLGNNGLLGSNGLLGGILKRSPTTADLFGKRQTVDFDALSAAVASLGSQTTEAAGEEGDEPVNFPLSENVEPQAIAESAD